MPWIRRDLKRSYACNVRLLKFFRERKNWSQKQLADASIMSERAISKAESGKPVSPGTIDKLAKALSDDKIMVFPEDLITDTIELAKAYMQAFHLSQENMVRDIRRFTDPNAVFHIAGDPRKIPFAGMHNGLEEFDRAMKTFFRLFEVPNDPNQIGCYTFYPKGNDVVVWGESMIHPIGRPMNAPMPVTLRFSYRRGKLNLVEDRYDVNLGQQALRKYSNIPILRSKRKSNLDDSHFDLEDSSFDLPVS